MSRIDKLIAGLCPDGVEFKTLASLGEWYGGGTPSKKQSGILDRRNHPLDLS